MIRVPRDRHRSSGRRGAEGQILVVFVAGLVALLGFTALVIDGGNVWAQQRMTQNGSDASSEAGAVILAQKLAGQPTPAGGWDAAVLAQVQTIATANKINLGGAFYTDICGIPLQADGTAALDVDGSYDLAVAAAVGSGFPTSSATSPDCPNRVVGPPAGVLVVANRSVDTYLARIVGIDTFTPTTQATAVAGWVTGFCDADQGEACKLLPITINVNAVTCDGHNNIVNTGLPWEKFRIYRVPLCGNDPGNVGWLDWDPPAGGIPDIIDSINVPDNPPIDLPSWQYVSQTGDTNSKPLEDALRAYDGEVVHLPMFDLTCNPGNGVSPDSSKPAVVTGPNYGCPAGSLGGNGQNQWYRFPSFAAFRLCDPSIAACGGFHGSYINGNNRAECDSGNGATSCLIGEFVDVITTGPVSAGDGGGAGFTKIVGTQLIK